MGSIRVVSDLDFKLPLSLIFNVVHTNDRTKQVDCARFPEIGRQCSTSADITVLVVSVCVSARSLLAFFTPRLPELSAF